MKNIVKFLKDTQGVSPVIGVILMVAITVVLGAVVAAFAYGYVGNMAKAPNVALTVIDDPRDSVSLILKDHAGDSVPAGDWSYGTASGKDAPISSDNWTAGSDNLTPGYSTKITESSAGWYHVEVKHLPSNSVLLDTNAQVR